MDIEKLKKSAEGRGFSFRYFATGAEAADYLAQDMAGLTVGIGGCATADAIGVYDKLTAVCPDVVWHWKTGEEARVRAMTTESYITGANAISETGEIVNIDGTGNRLAANFYGHKRLYIVAGVNKIEPTLERAIWRARNIAAPLRARGMGMDTPCAKGELKCYDCRSPQRLCRGLGILMEPMMGMEKAEIVIIGEELGG